MVGERSDDIILSPGQPAKPGRGCFPFVFGKRRREQPILTVGPYQVGIIIWDGAVLDIFSEGKQMLPEGEVQTYVASTAPFKFTFRLKAQGKPSNQYDIVLDPPLMTSDVQHITGRIDLTVSVIAQGSRLTSVIPERADRLLQLLGLSSDVVTKSDIARMIKGELSPKLLALDLHTHTADELRNSRELLSDISSALKKEVAEAIDRFGLQLDDFQINLAPPPQKATPIKQLERNSRLEAPKSRRKSRSSAPAKSAPKQTRTQNLEPSRGTRLYHVYTDQPTRKSTIHTETCSWFLSRRSSLRSDNWWHGPYTTKADAMSSSRNVGTVRECGTCHP